MFHLEQRQNKQPNLHLKKPGSCVSLLPVTRSRTRRVRKPRPCCGAARFRVFFHDKHFQRRALILSIYVSPTAVLVGGVEGGGGSKTGGRKIILTPQRATCVIFSSLPSSSSGSFAFVASNQPPNSSKLTAVVFSAGCPTTSNSETIQYPPICPPYLRWLSLAVFLIQRAFSLSLSLSLPAPRFCC